MSTPPGSAWRSAPTLAPDSHGRLVALCKRPARPRAARHRPRHPAPAGDQGAARQHRRDDRRCGGSFYLDTHDRAVVATADRHVLVVATDDAEGDPDLTTRASRDLIDAGARPTTA